MKYICLGYLEEHMWDGWSEQEQKNFVNECMAYDTELRKNKNFIGGEALQSVRMATTVRYKNSKPSVTDGPFAETKELIAGYWLWQVKSKQEAIAWVKRCPNPMPGESEIEILQVFEAEDFGAEFTPELREQEERVRAQVAKKK